MVCPYCGKEMEEGLISNRYPLLWRKGSNRYQFRLMNKEDVKLSGSFMYGSAVKVFNCRDCKKMIIDYADPYYDLNNKDSYHY